MTLATTAEHHGAVRTIQTIATAYAKLVMEAAPAEVQMVLGVGVGPEVVQEVAVAQGVMAVPKAAVAQEAMAQEVMAAMGMAVDQAAALAAAPVTATKPKKVQPAPVKHMTIAVGAPHVKRAVNPAVKYGAASLLTVTPSAGVWTDTIDALTFILVLAHPSTRRPQLRALAEGRDRRRQRGCHRVHPLPVAMPRIAAKAVLQWVELILLLESLQWAL
jgi:hypothetical protein